MPALIEKPKQERFGFFSENLEKIKQLATDIILISSRYLWYIEANDYFV